VEPVLVKPTVKTDWEGSPVYNGLFSHAGKARIFANGKAAAADPLVQAMRDSLQFQEYVPGDDRSLWSFHGFADEKATLVDWFVGRKIRAHPALTGDSTYLELAPNDELVQAGRDVARRLGLRGVFKMDFKRHEITGRYYLLEVNARFNLWQYLGAANGVNFMRTAYDFLLEEKRPAPATYQTRTRWLSLELDARAFRALRMEGKLGVAGWLGSLLFARKVYNLFSWTDPGPWLMFWARRFTRLGTRAPSRFISIVRQWRSTAS